MGVSAGVRADALTYVAHVLAAAAAALVLVWCIHFRGGLAFESSNKFLIFNIHPVLMVIGFIILGSEAILSYRTLPWRKEVKKRIHMILQAAALMLGAVGIYATFKFHNESGIANLYSLHSWVGLGTISLYGIQWIYGFLTFFYPGVGLSLKQVLVPWHMLFGLCVYIMAIAAAELGFLEKLTFLLQSGAIAKRSSEALLVNFTALVVILLGVFVAVSTVLPRLAALPQDIPLPDEK